MNSQATDQNYMARAIQLAKKGHFTTHPNPRVGCVIVKNNQIIGEGYHLVAGQPHAEVNALSSVKSTNASLIENATAYVTLEPCSHIGKTPPCADALVNSGVKRVVVAMLDPNPQVSGRGVKKLLDANIDVSVGILEEQSRVLNPGFIKRMEKNRPFIRIKMAMSLDGKTAMSSGESQWITGSEARQDVQRLRAQSDAILTGTGTVIDDNPSLNVRLKPIDLGFEEDQFESCRQPLRVVLDSYLRIQSSAKMLSLPGDTLIYTCNGDNDKIQELSQSGAEVKVLTTSHISLHDVVSDLAAREINEVHVEAGATLCGALLSEQLVDEIIIYMAPTILGGDAKSLFNLPALQLIKDKVGLDIKDIRAIGKDWRITAIPNF
ncbi:MAG: diaminohydroxyphosphoribosylaminopyrimidine deaminase [Cocleimonas sp.]|jgi:diaminohydroxyphosphoribosylaminopyrimidine deaminase/5-amino-6-(5-phosphoribosylamino)uracil reductase